MNKRDVKQLIEVAIVLDSLADAIYEINNLWGTLIKGAEAVILCGDSAILNTINVMINEIYKEAKNSDFPGLEKHFQAASEQLKSLKESLNESKES